MRILAFLILFGILSCSKKKDCFQSETNTFFKDNSHIDTGRNVSNFYARVITGSMLVFTYETETSGCYGYPDATGTAQRLIFEVDPSVSSFAYNSPDFQNANVYYSYSCGECPSAVQDAVVPGSGTITGTKLNSGSWRVDYDITTATHGRSNGSAMFWKQ